MRIKSKDCINLTSDERFELQWLFNQIMTASKVNSDDKIIDCRVYQISKRVVASILKKISYEN